MECTLKERLAYSQSSYGYDFGRIQSLRTVARDEGDYKWLCRFRKE